MSIVTRPNYRRGQKQLDNGHLNDGDMQGRQLRKGLQKSVIGMKLQTGANSMGNQEVGEVMPVIYKLISVSDPGDSSSSSSEISGERHAYIRQVNIDTVVAYGPTIRVRMGNFA